MFDYAFRQGDWVMLPPYPGKNKEYELYNIKEDPMQQNNLADKERKRLRQMMMRFEQLKRETQKITDF